MSQKAQGSLPGIEEDLKRSSTVECLGMTFENDEARRNYFLEQLRTKLQDPDFRQIAGFPRGEDEDILALSDPPYYTACPNPFITQFIKHYGTAYDADHDEYHRAPFAADVSEGKRNPIYNAHSYHTKVPHKAAMRFLLHYTNPGDIIYDGFCGSGLTGVAARLCGDKAAIADLGYQVDRNGNILDERGSLVSKYGSRHCILSDLAPAATFIAYNYTFPCDPESFDDSAAKALRTLSEKCRWLYATTDPETGQDAEISQVIWSDVFICPSCGSEFVFWEAALNSKRDTLRSTFPCPHCGAKVGKTQLEHTFESYFDHIQREVSSRIKATPAEIRFSVAGSEQEYTMEPGADDLKLLSRIEKEKVCWHPANLMLFKDGVWGDQWRKGYHTGVTHDYHFYLPRSLTALSQFYDIANRDRRLLFLLTGSLLGLTRLQRYSPGSTFPNMIRSGTLYIGSIHREWNVYHWLSGKSRALSRFFRMMPDAPSTTVTGTASSTDERLLPEGSIDYVFVDPPFGDNLAYSELNFLWEGWLRVFTNQTDEAIISKAQGKGFNEYAELMEKCFACFYRALKPGRWITVVFHNSKNAVWNAIQEGLQRAGFVVADVRTIDKQQGSYNQTQAAGAVKKDLVISAYKPATRVVQEFELQAGNETAVWSFVRSHLEQVPCVVEKGGRLEVVMERQKYLLFDRMVAFHIERGVSVPMSASEFYLGLEERFPQRDGMYFLPEQVAEYDRKRMLVEEVVQLELFVTNELSAIQWLKQELANRPRTFQELQPIFMREVAGWEKYEKPLELSKLLEEGFLCYEGKGDVPSQVHSYLSTNFHELRNLEKDDPKLIAKAKNRWYVPDPRKEADLEKIRHRSLMREFEDYRKSKGKLKVVRTEALRAGFKDCWQTGDYDTIVKIAGRVKDEIIQEDPALLMYFDNASMRTED